MPISAGLGIRRSLSGARQLSPAWQTMARFWHALEFKKYGQNGLLPGRLFLPTQALTFALFIVQ